MRPIVPAGVDGGISVFATNNTQLVLDISGYFVHGAGQFGIGFFLPHSVPYRRYARSGGTVRRALTCRRNRRARSPILASSCRVPSFAQAYSLNFTAIPRGPLGYLTTWPAGHDCVRGQRLRDRVFSERDSLDSGYLRLLWAVVAWVVYFYSLTCWCDGLDVKDLSVVVVRSSYLNSLAGVFANFFSIVNRVHFLGPGIV